MSGPLYHDEDIYKIFPSDRHKDTEYGFDDLVKGYSCEIKFDIDSDIVEYDENYLPEIRINIKVMDSADSNRFWYLKYSIKRENWIKGFIQETKDDFMIKVKTLVKQNNIENRDVKVPETHKDYIEVI